MLTNKKPLVSVLMPAYNHQNYVQEAINSIIHQTYKNIELIVLDDGSTDDTWEILKSLKQQCDERFVNVVFETKENEGICATLNKLLDKKCEENGCVVLDTELGMEDRHLPTNEDKDDFEMKKE